MTLETKTDTPPRNVLAPAAPLAWLTLAMMALSAVWPESQHMLIQKRYPFTPGWALMLSVLVLAVLLSFPRIWPKRRILASKVLALGILLVCFLFAAPAAVFCLAMLTGKIFHEVGKK